MTKKILIVADPYGKPSFAPRLRYLCDYLKEQGHTVVVYTEEWEPLNFARSYTIRECVIYRSSFDWAIKSFWSLLTDWKNRYFSFWLRTETEKKHYDLVFCTTFSTFPLRAARDIAKERNIPFIADLRDLDEQVPGAQYQSHRQWWTIPFRQWYQKVNIHRRNKLLRQADCITTVSPWHVDFIRQFNANVHLIYNGYDPKAFFPKDVPNDTFIISYMGRLYDFQKMNLIEQVLQELNLPDCELSMHTPDTNYIAFSEVGNEIRKSSIMLVLTHPNTKGVMTTKFFEALGCEKPVLCIPSDEGCLADAIQETNAGLASGDKEEIKAFILDKYNEWKKNGFTHQPVRNKEKFSRLYQAKQFEDLFNHSTSL